MCVAVPVKVVEVLPDDMIRGRVAGGETEIHLSSLLLSEPATVGDYVLMHAGFAMQRLDAEEAEKTLALFRELGMLKEV